MYSLRIKQVIALVVLLGAAGLAQASTPTFPASPDRSVDLPPGCSLLQVSDDSKVVFHVYAQGVQIYKWNGATWDFVAPLAVLYASQNYHGQVGTHYVGPTWESNSGSTVVARRLQGCQPDPTAIPWLLLEATATEGPGIFSRVTHIQRVNTAGGLVPATPGSSIGEISEVPYTAEYYFYRARD